MSPELEKQASGEARTAGWFSAHRRALVTASVAIGVFVLGYVAGTMGRDGTGHDGHGDGTDAESAEKKALFWTCSMHPQIKQPSPGQCPICAMDLIPVFKDGGEELGPRELRMSASARKLAAIATSPVERRFATAEVNMVGRVEYDETRLRHITAWVGGRLDRLYVDYTGVTVNRGDHMVWLYSPEVLAAQEELLQSVKAVKEVARSDSEAIKRTASQTVDAAREKLRLWGLTAQQISGIERRGTPEDHITIYAPMGGVVVQKHVAEGAYVKTGTRIYGIADLTQVWIKLDAYESDLKWVRYGQKVQFSTEAYPGETFAGRIAFIDPVLDAKTRTVKLRVNVPNESGRLKPGMFVRATVHSQVAEGDRIVDADLAGKWIGPMHPEIVKDGPGTCDICGMPLKPAAELGYISGESRDAPLVIPATAPLITGRRAVVYVADPDREGVFEGREVVLGPRAGDYYVVEEGLKEGESVVTSGNFKIDSALQILARPSMMNPEGGGPTPGHHHHGSGAKGAGTEGSDADVRQVHDVPPEFTNQLKAAFEGYLALQRTLAGDDFGGAQNAAKQVRVAIDGVDMKLLEGDAHVAWMKDLEALTSRLARITGAEDIDAARTRFAALSEAVIGVAKSFGIGTLEINRFRCPMALDGKGADWLSAGTEVRNPYYGASMLKCGEMVGPLTPKPEGH